MTAELLRLIAAQICLHAAMTGTRLAGPLLALQQGHSPAAVGMLLALFALTQVFLALPAGRYVDRHGMLKPLSMAVMAAVTGASLSAAFPVFQVFCLSALLTGGATGVATIALQRHVGRAAKNPTQLKRVFSWLAISPAAANFVGPFAAGLLIDHAGFVAGDLLGFRVAFAVLAALPVLGWWFARRTQELPPKPPAAGAPRPRTFDLLREPMFRRLLFVNWLQSSAWDMHNFVLPILGHERGLSASTIGALLGAFAIAAAGIRVVLSQVASRVGERQVIMTSNVTIVLVFAVYPFMQSALGMGVCSVVLGIALGAVQPMVMSMLHQITPHERHGEALGLRVLALNASSVAMPMVFGAAGALIGISGVFWIVGGIVALGTRATNGLKVPESVPAPRRKSDQSL